MSSTISAASSTSAYLNAANWSYAQAGTAYEGPNTALPTGFNYFTDGGTNLIDYDPATGLYSAALVAPSGQVMVVFEGTNLSTGNTEFSLAQISDDLSIVHGTNALSYAPALSFAQQVLADAETQGYTPQDVVLAGHSLGAAEAEYVATQTGLSGETFGTPGIPLADITASSTGQMTDYVERGDPVGNYAQGGNIAALLQNPNIVHYGTTQYIGSYYGTALLTGASLSYLAAQSATTITGQLAALSATLTALTTALPYHHLTTYANDLGITISGADNSINALSPNQVTDLADGEAILAASSGLDFAALPPDITSGRIYTGPGAGPLLAAAGEPFANVIPGLSLAASGAVIVSGSEATVNFTSGQSIDLALPGPAGQTFSLSSAGQDSTQISLGATRDGYVFDGSDGVSVTGDAAPLDVIGGSGPVSVIGGSGNLSVSGATNSGVSTFAVGGSGSNLLTGGAGPTTITAGTGASTLIGGSGPTIMFTAGRAPNYVVAGSGATSINATTGTGNTLIFAGSGPNVIALGAGADSVIGGSGPASIIGGSAPDVYGFINGHAGGSDVIDGLKASDAIVFGGYSGDPITSEGVLNGSDLLTLSDGTTVLFVGVDHTIFS